ncbi:MAG: hypothetical protein ACRC62_05375 [Microcoleus sp.]
MELFRSQYQEVQATKNENLLEVLLRECFQEKHILCILNRSIPNNKIPTENSIYPKQDTFAQVWAGLFDYQLVQEIR